MLTEVYYQRWYTPVGKGRRDSMQRKFDGFTLHISSDGYGCYTSKLLSVGIDTYPDDAPVLIEIPTEAIKWLGLDITEGLRFYATLEHSEVRGWLDDQMKLKLNAAIGFIEREKSHA